MQGPLAPVHSGLVETQLHYPFRNSAILFTLCDCNVEDLWT